MLKPLRGDWRVDVGDAPVHVLVHVLLCQQAWAALTRASRTAVVALADDASAPVHPATRRALERHGLLDVHGLTQAGRQVAQWRPRRPAPSDPDVVITRLDRPVVDVPLPPLERTPA